MSINLLLRALRKCEREFQEFYDADDDLETHIAWKRRERQAEKIEARIVKMFKAIPLCAVCSGILVRTIEEELGISGKPTGILK